MNTPHVFFSPLCIYRLSNGINLFCEDVLEEGEDLVFNMDRTAVLLIVQGPQGLSINAERASDSPYTLSAGKMRIARRHVVAIQSTTNSELLEGARKAISGIEIVKGPHR